MADAETARRAMEAATVAFDAAMSVARERRSEDGMNPAVWPGSPEHDDDRQLALLVSKAAIDRAYGDG